MLLSELIFLMSALHQSVLLFFSPHSLLAKGKKRKSCFLHGERRFLDYLSGTTHDDDERRPSQAI